MHRFLDATFPENSFAPAFAEQLYGATLGFAAAIQDTLDRLLDSEQLRIGISGLGTAARDSGTSRATRWSRPIFSTRCAALPVPARTVVECPRLLGHGAAARAARQILEDDAVTASNWAWR